jgi:hypothetical protein
VCLANSERPGGHCIAGIDLDSGEWIRPVPRDHDAVPISKCVIDGKLLTTLDIFEVELVRPRETPRFQRENRIIRDWNWSLVRRFKRSDLPKYCDRTTPILYSTTDRVSPATLERLRPEQWASLQLVAPRKLTFERDNWDPHRWRARFHDVAGNKYRLRITDASTTRRLESGTVINPSCVLTISLTKPWAPSDDSQPARCYKLVAAVIEI